MLSKCMQARSVVTLSRQWVGAVAPVTKVRRKYRVAIVGGGAGGVSVAAQLARKMGGGSEIAVIEPSDRHLYMPLWTMVGGLGIDVNQSARPMEMVMPTGVQWVKERCEEFHPERSCVKLGNGEELGYEVLVVSAGLQQNFGQVKGLQETMGKNGVASIYSFEHAPAVWRHIQALKGGQAIFTNPATAVNCGGAPQKIAYLAEDAWRSAGKRDEIDVDFFTATPGIFGCPHYRVALEAIMTEKNMRFHTKANLVEVDGPARLAVFADEEGEVFSRHFDFLHVTPPMSAPDFIRRSPLANAAGFVDVDKETCQHVRFPNVYSLGDCSSLPTSKTYSAISGEAPVVVHNALQTLEGRSSAATAAYDGYTACPILLGRQKLMLAEFNGYTMEPQPTFWPLDQRRPSFLFFLMKRFIFEQAYWHLVPLGRWFGKRTIFPPPVRQRSVQPEQPSTMPAPPMVHAALTVANVSLAATEDSGEGSDHLLPARLGVETPDVPGDISCVGSLPESVVAQLAPRYKAWLYLNPTDHPDFHAAAIKAGGCKLETMHLPGGLSGGRPTDGHAHELQHLIGTLPRPLMLQCTSGNRSSAALLLWLAKAGGHNAESAAQLAKDMSLKFFSHHACGPVWDWVAAQLGGSQVQQEVHCMVEQLFDTQGSHTFTYALGDPATKEAVLVDPVLGMEERDLTLLEERGYTLKYVVNTHCHADHVTSGSALKALRPGVRTAIAKAAGAKADWLLQEGDRVEFGNYALETLATPGHTSGCLSFVLRGPGDPKAVFTGDALLIRGCGRTDFQQGDAEALYDNIHGKIFSLPDDTKVYPGHDYQGRNLSSVLEEKSFNPRLTKSKAEFVQLMANLNLPYPKLIDTALPANLLDGAR